MDTQFPPINHPEVARLRRQSAQRKYRKQLRKMRLLWSCSGVLFLILFIEVLVALCHSPRLWIYRITVTNQETLSDAEVVRLMAVPVHSNYFRISLGKLERNIEQEPRVDTAVVKHGAIGTLVVTVHERQAVCQLGYTGQPLYMDAKGFLFTRPAPPTTLVPVIEGVSVPYSKGILGKRAPFPQVDEVLACLAELRGAKDRTALEVARLKMTPNGNGTTMTYTAILRQGTLLYLGPPTFLEKKGFCIRQAVLEKSNEGRSLTQIKYIDVGFVDENSEKKGICAYVYPSDK